MNNNLYEYICSEVKNGNNHFFVTAQGGAGKTMQLRYIERELIKRAEKGEKIIPVYIDVKALDNSADYPVFNYIRRFFGKDVDVNDTKDLFELNNNISFQEYTIYFLIDALNETIDDYKIIDDIRIICNCENCVVVMTSRVNEDIIDSFITVEIKPLSKGQVFNMIEKKYDIDVFPNVEINQSLMEILQIPLFLVTFLNTYSDKKDYSLLYDALFYNKNSVRKAQILDAYKNKLLSDLNERRNGTENETVLFIINYFLPAVAFLMVKKNSFSLNREEIDEKLNDCYFEKFIRGSKKEKIRKLLNSVDFMPSTISSKQGFIVDNDDEWSFSHQIWRDYFCAMHIVNVLKNAKEYSELEIYLDEDIREFVGELFKNDDGLCECDFESKNDLDSPMSPIEEYMQKNNQKLNESPNSIKNLINIMKVSRNNQITAVFNNLDLQNVSFDNCFLQHSNFDESKLCKRTFFQRGHSSSISAIEFASFGDKNYIISGDIEGHIIIWDLKTRQQIGELISENADYILSLKHISINNNNCLICCTHTEVYIWDLSKMKLVTVKGTSKGITACDYISVNENNYLVTGDGYGILKIWDINKELLPLELDDNSGVMITALSVVPYDNYNYYIACGKANGTIQVWDLEKKIPVGDPIKCHDKKITAMAFISTNIKKYIVSASHDNTIKLLDVEKKFEAVKTLKGHTKGITDLAYTSINGVSYLLSSSYDESIRIWNIDKGIQVEKPIIISDEYDISNLSSIAIATYNNKNYVISADWTTNIYIWDLNFRHQKPDVIKSYKHGVGSLDYLSFDNKAFIASVDFNGIIRLWNVETGRLAINSLTDEHCATNISYANISGENCLLSGGCDGVIRTWNIETGEPLSSLNWIHETRITAVTYASLKDDDYIITGNNYGEIKVWSLNKQCLIRKIKGHTNGVMSIVFAIINNKPYFISSGQEYSGCTIKFWNFDECECPTQTITERDFTVEKIQFATINNKPCIVATGFGCVKIINIINNKSYYLGDFDMNTSLSFVSFKGKNYLAFCEFSIISILELNKDANEFTGKQANISTISSSIFECNFENAIFEPKGSYRLPYLLYQNGGLISQQQIEEISNKEPYEL